MIVWLLVVVLSLQLLNARRELKALRARLREDEAQPSLPKDNDPGSQSGLKGAHQDLIVLRLELKRMTAAGALAEDLYQRLTQAIDAQWTAELSEAPSADGMWSTTLATTVPSHCAKAAELGAHGGSLPYRAKSGLRGRAGMGLCRGIPTTACKHLIPAARSRRVWIGSRW
jgi:hypothetical protein